jgi:MYXO-CTERM domain-containing protein
VHRPNPETSTPRDSEPGPRRAAVAGWLLLLVVLLFAYQRTQPTHVYLGPIRLE